MTETLERVREFLEAARESDAMRKARAELLVCRNCGERVEFTRGKAFSGWVHINGHLICQGKHALATPESHPDYMLGNTICDLQDAADRIEAKQAKRAEILSGQELWQSFDGWSEVYFRTGELSIPKWALICRIRERLCDGAECSGEMSPGAAAAWFLLQPIQEEFEMEQ